jgi:hypothetical protein
MSLLIALQQFLGANTQRNPKEPLGPGIGVDARNLDTSRGDFRGLKAADVVHTLTGLGVQQISAYRFGRDTASDTQYWLTSSLDVNWVRSLIALDTTERTYWTDGVKPRYTDSTILGSPPYPTGSVTLGVPAPSAAMTATNTTPGAGPDETRVYLDTFLRANGDESAPNANTTSITVPGGSSVTLNGFAAVPGGSHGITKRRIYVFTGTGDFLRVVEQTAATASYVDNGSSRGAVLGTGGSASRPTWLEPPDAMVGLTELWGGMIGGHVGKSLRICVPDFPHAWPIEYEYIVPHTVVGTAKFGTNWVVVTTGNPYVLTGSKPGSLQQSPVQFDQAGVSKRSVVSVKHGVCWASKDGLCYFGTNGPSRVLTAPFIDTATWQALDPTTIIGAHWRGWYLGFYFDGVNRKGFMVNTLDPQGVIWLDQGAFGVFEDSISGSVYLLDSSFRIRKWYTGSLLTATFKTGKVRANHETNPARAMVVGTSYTSASLKVYADDVLKHTASPTSREPFWLPSGYVGRDFQLELSGAGPLEAAILAEETVDLP